MHVFMKSSDPTGRQDRTTLAKKWCNELGADKDRIYENGSFVALVDDSS